MAEAGRILIQDAAMRRHLEGRTITQVESIPNADDSLVLTLDNGSTLYVDAPSLYASAGALLSGERTPEPGEYGYEGPECR